jgi:general secretion pathway protein G
MPRASAVTVAAHQSTQKNAGMAQAAAPLPNRLKVDLMNAIAFRPQARSARRLRGFTLIEIMVVITILGVLAALIVPRVVGRTDDARIAAARQDIAQIMGALKLYRLDNGRYPTTEQGLRALIEKPATEPLPTNWKQGGYLERSSTPKDPWGRDYQYLNPGLRGEIDVFSFGRDGQSGGEGPDADIGSWSL